MKTFLKYSLIALLLASSTIAQQVSMGPSIVETLISPGSKKYFFLNVRNESNVDLECRLSLADMDLTEQGMPIITQDSTRSIKEWMTIDGNSTFKLEAGDAKPIRVFIKTPLNIRPGSYYGMVVCSTTNSKQVLSTEFNGTRPVINIRYQFTSVIMITVKGSNLHADIQTEPAIFHAGKRTAMTEERKWSVQVPVINRGNIHVTVQGDVEIFSQNGQLVEHANLEVGRGYLLPTKRRIFKATGNGPLPDGVYKANIRVGNIKENHYASGSFDFYIEKGNTTMGLPDSHKKRNMESESQGFMIDKPLVDIECVPGGKKTQVLRITNVNNDSLPLTVHLTQWGLNDDGTLFITPSNKTNEMISVEPRQFVVQPKRRKNLKIQINMDKSFTGEVFPAISVINSNKSIESAKEQLYTQSSLLNISGKGTLVKNGKLESWLVNNDKNTGVIFDIKVKNTGNCRIFPLGRISLFDANNTRIGDPLEFTVNDFILPNSSRTFKAKFDRVLPNGKYSSQLTILYDDEKKVIKDELIFNIANDKAIISKR